jgi:hypothetical protein
VVLIRRRGLGALVLITGCSESLFATQASGGPGDPVHETCPAGCLADAAADLATGSVGWQFLEDHRNRTWSSLAASSDPRVLQGREPGNQVTSCAARPTAAACRTLPGALLVSSAGASAGADPAIAVTLTSSRVVQLTVLVFVAEGKDQTIRLYRNSREDALDTATASAGSVLRRELTLTALPGDRFVVAIAPVGAGASEVGVHMFVSPRNDVPSDCQLALRFDAVTGDQTPELCGGRTYSHLRYMSPGISSPAPIVTGAAPFAALEEAIKVSPDHYLITTTPVLTWSAGMTVQLWVQLTAQPVIGQPAWLFSDLDRDDGAGLGIFVIGDPGNSQPQLVAQELTPGSPSVFRDLPAALPGDGAWQFVRVVRTERRLTMCVNGNRVASVDREVALTTRTLVLPGLGRDPGANALPHLDAKLDDVRAITGALPCE